MFPVSSNRKIRLRSTLQLYRARDVDPYCRKCQKVTHWSSLYGLYSEFCEPLHLVTYFRTYFVHSLTSSPWMTACLRTLGGGNLTGEYFDIASYRIWSRIRVVDIYRFVAIFVQTAFFYFYLSTLARRCRHSLARKNQYEDQADRLFETISIQILQHFKLSVLTVFVPYLINLQRFVIFWSFLVGFLQRL